MAHTPPARPDLRGHTVLVLHAHPDDESIFTGITLRRLADAGARTVLVTATAGDLGHSHVPLRAGETLAQRRVAELERAAETLGVTRLVLLGCRDSGLPGWESGHHARALAATDPLLLGRRIARLAERERAATIVFDDDEGIYGHPDHRAAHRVGSIAAQFSGAQPYLVTVDRDHLPPGRHLVHGAARSAAVGYGRPGAEITLAVSGGPRELARKRAAITAHRSQITDDDVPFGDFARSYGREWFRRAGAPGVLDALGDTRATDDGWLSAA